MGGISMVQIAIIVIVVAVLFGGKRLRNLGGDLGTSLKGFKKAMSDDDNSQHIEHKESTSEIGQEKSDSIIEKKEDNS